MKTLVLNIDFSPLAIVEGKRGLLLSLNNSNIVVLDIYPDITIRSELDDYFVPAVLLYNKFVKPPARKVVSKRYVLARDDMVCQYCSVKLDHLTASVDHVVPVASFKSKLEANSWDNLVASCKDCNTKKGSRTPEQAKMQLNRVPQAPRGFMTVQQGPEIWSKYVSTVQNSRMGCETQTA